MRFGFVGISFVALTSLAASAASAGMVNKKIAYNIGGQKFEGVLVYDDSVSAKRPAVLMATRRATGIPIRAGWVSVG